MAANINSAVNPYAAPRAAVDDAWGAQEYQPVKLLSAAGRVGRVRYFVNSIGVYLTAGIFMGVIGALLGLAGAGRATSGLMSVAMLVLYLGMLIIGFMQAIQRNHDVDKSGWWVLLSLVPVVNIFYGLYLLFMPGTQGHNRYGAPPPPNTVVSVIIACVLPILVVGILAAVALPAYQAYAQRAAMHRH